MTEPTPWEPLVRANPPGSPHAYEFRCPGCGRWGDIDDDQYRGTVSIDHTVYEDGSPHACTFHENVDCRTLRHLAVGETATVGPARPLKARVATAVRWRRQIDVWWGECWTGDEHHAWRVLAEGADRAAVAAVEWPDDPAEWPVDCSCGQETLDRALISADDDGPGVSRSMSFTTEYDTPSGRPEPGCLYWVPCVGLEDTGACYSWDNCEGRHLHGVVPTGEDWEIDRRAGNCTLPADRLHRCWVRHGDPPDVHVDKQGLTCNAGAGSIQTGDWHGFLDHGVFHP